MTKDQYYYAVTEAAEYPDLDAYLSDVAMSTEWGDDPDAPIPQQRLDDLTAIFIAVHRTTRDILDLSGLSQASFAQRYAIPRRTFQDWVLGVRTCPLYLRLLLQQSEGLLQVKVSGGPRCPNRAPRTAG